jgi:hypothetical protein
LQNIIKKFFELSNCSEITSNSSNLIFDGGEKMERHKNELLLCFLFVCSPDNCTIIEEEKERESKDFFSRTC